MSGFCFCLKLSEPLEIEDGVKSVPSEYCHTIWCVQSRMIWLPDGEEKSEDTPTRFDRIHERRCLRRLVPMSPLLNMATLIAVCN